MKWALIYFPLFKLSAPRNNHFIVVICVVTLYFTSLRGARRREEGVKREKPWLLGAAASPKTRSRARNERYLSKLL